MAADSGGFEREPFLMFQSSDERRLDLGLRLGFLDSVERPLLPPPPCVEVLPSKVSESVKYTVEEVDLGSVKLLKGQVRTQDVFSLSNSDLVPGKYEGGLKLWEGSIDLVKTLESEACTGNLSFEGKRVLELGCGHGLPGIFTCIKGASAVHFQDFNQEVLRCLTIPNVRTNLPEQFQPMRSNAASSEGSPEIRFFAGDWSDVNSILPLAQGDPPAGYDVILMAETVYSITALPKLYRLIKMCLSQPDGVVYMAGKKHYFGVGGGTRWFLSLVEKDGAMASSLVTEVADGSSNVREVWKLCCKSI
ncbi:Histidine protein methyltransferase 1-like protein [Drosera capensis]